MNRQIDRTRQRSKNKETFEIYEEERNAREPDKEREEKRQRKRQREREREREREGKQENYPNRQSKPPTRREVIVGRLAENNETIC